MTGVTVLLVVILFAFGNQVCTTPSEILESSFGNGTRIRGVSDRENDFVLGGLFPIHGASTSGGQCGEIRQEAGVEDMEAMLFALDRINSDPILLPNLTIGYDIRDTCYSENIGLDEALDLIVTGTERSLIHGCNDVTEIANFSSEQGQRIVPTFGIIGPTASGVSVQVAGLGRLFEMPQVSFASSSALLNNRDRYSFFYRTIPPDNFQAKVMIKILLHFNWTHISVVYSKNAYGTPGKDDIVKLAKENQICIDVEEGISTGFHADHFSELAATLDNSTARVVIAFTTSADAGKLLKAMVSKPSFANITWIASDDWSEAGSVLANFDSHSFGGMIGVTPAAQHVDDLHSYLTQLTIAENLRNPWFAEYFSAKTGCDLDTCSVNMSISEASQRNLLPLVIDAVYALAHALDNFLEENCNQPLVWYRDNMTCMGQKRELNGTNILAYLQNVSFVSPTGNEIEFDQQGNIQKASYRIVSYKVNSNESRVYGSIVYIGLWNTGGLLEGDSLGMLQLLNEDFLYFGNDGSEEGIGKPPTSECGRCVPGQYLKPVISSCCGICNPCLGQEYSLESQAPVCKNCSEFGEYWGNNPLEGSDGCVQLKEVFLDFSDPYSIVITIFASLGQVAVITVAVILGIHWNTPVVKSFSREQIVFLLIGISLSFIVAYIYVAPPVLGICITQRIGLWLCFSLMFGSLLVKVVRITRIFLSKSQMKKVRFAETHYQVLFTLLLLVGQMLLVTASVAYKHPSINRHLRLNRISNYDFPDIVVTCSGDPLAFILLSVLYESALIATMTLLGVISFKFPANFNEAKYISFCTFAIVIIWMGFIPSYFATQQLEEYQNAVISMAVMLSAFAVLACIFGPRLYIILFHADRNSNNYSRNKKTLVSTLASRPTLVELEVPSEENSRNITLNSTSVKIQKE